MNLSPYWQRAVPGLRTCHPDVCLENAGFGFSPPACAAASASVGEDSSFRRKLLRWAMGRASDTLFPTGDVAMARLGPGEGDKNGGFGLANALVSNKAPFFGRQWLVQRLQGSL